MSVDLRPMENKLASDLYRWIIREGRLRNFRNRQSLASRIADRVISDVETRKVSTKGDTFDFLKVQGQDYVNTVERSLPRSASLNNDLKRFPVIVVVGAGLSFEAGLPLTYQLKNMLKPILGYEPEDLRELREAFRKIRGNKKADRKFKRTFRRFIEDGLRTRRIQFTDAQEVLIGKFTGSRKAIYEILCLNWDNLIERCHARLKRAKMKKINRHTDKLTIQKDGFAHCLWKFHGDVEDIEYPWIYPGMKGRVFGSFKKYYQSSIRRHDISFVLLIVGYSELDESIRKSIIETIERHYVTYRTGLDLDLVKSCKDYIFAPAEWLLPQVF